MGSTQALLFGERRRIRDQLGVARQWERLVHTQPGQGLGIQHGGHAATEYHPGRRVSAARPVDELAGLPISGFGHRAGVDDVQVCLAIKAYLGGQRPQTRHEGLAVRPVDLAPQGCDGDPQHGLRLPSFRSPGHRAIWYPSEKCDTASQRGTWMSLPLLSSSCRRSVRQPALHVSIIKNHDLWFDVECIASLNMCQVVVLPWLPGRYFFNGQAPRMSATANK